MLLIKYVMQSFVNPMPKSVIFSLKKDKYERDLKMTNNARAKKDRRSRNSIPSASLASLEDSTAQEPSARLSEIKPDPAKTTKIVPFEQESASSLRHHSHKSSLRTILSLPNYSSEESPENVAAASVIEHLSPGNCSTEELEPAAFGSVEVSDMGSVEKSSFIEKNHQGDVATVGMRSHHLSLQSDGSSSANGIAKELHSKKCGLSPKRSPLRSFSSALSAQRPSSPKNALRRRAVSTCTYLGKENDTEGLDAHESTIDTLTPHEMGYLPTPRRLQLEDIMKSTHSDGISVKDLRKLFDRKST